LTALPELSRYGGPLLMISGEADQVSDVEALMGFDGQDGRIQVVAVPAADHFWWGHERALQGAIEPFFARTLTGAAPRLQP
jgi:alpha/beta superfamily hydrolase